jgi:hypothetical protein
MPKSTSPPLIYILFFAGNNFSDLGGKKSRKDPGTRGKKRSIVLIIHLNHAFSPPLSTVKGGVRELKKKRRYPFFLFLLSLLLRHGFRGGFTLSFFFFFFSVFVPVYI